VKGKGLATSFAIFYESIIISNKKLKVSKNLRTGTQGGQCSVNNKNRPTILINLSFK
jgi:hypothetical protein